MLVGTHNFYLVEKGLSNVNKEKSSPPPKYTTIQMFGVNTI